MVLRRLHLLFIVGVLLAPTGAWADRKHGEKHQPERWEREYDDSEAVRYARDDWDDVVYNRDYPRDHEAAKEWRKEWKERDKELREAWREAEKDRREAQREWMKAEHEAEREWLKNQREAEREYEKDRREARKDRGERGMRNRYPW